MISDGETTKRKVPILEELCNLLVDKVLIWNHLCMENYSWISQIWIWTFQMTSDGEATKKKDGDVQKVKQIFIWHYLANVNYV
jgi:hypothetical protein